MLVQERTRVQYEFEFECEARCFGDGPNRLVLVFSGKGAIT